MQCPVPPFMNNKIQNDDPRLISITKGEERYIYLFSPTKEARGRVLETLGRHAANPHLSLTWNDAAALSQRVHTERAVTDLMTVYLAQDSFVRRLRISLAMRLVEAKAD